MNLCLQKHSRLAVIKMKLQQRFTPLLPLLASILKRCKSRRELQMVVYEQKLKLALIQKDPNLCLSDFKHSILASTSRKEEFNAHPFNKLPSNYYRVRDKSWIHLNSSLEKLSETSEFPSPYEPYFHFKDNYNEYLQERPTLSYRTECDSITIYSWCLRLVNIGQTGSYGIVIIILDSEKKGGKFVQNIANVSSILYEQEVYSKMEAFRLQEIRKKFQRANDEAVPHSLFYYLRHNMEVNRVKKRPNNIFTIDSAQNYLKYSTNFRLIGFGQMEGIGCLQFPLKAINAELNRQKLRSMHAESMSVLFSKLKVIEHSRGKSKELELWSSESEDEQAERSFFHSNQTSKEPSEFELQEDSDAEDPLRNLYLKQFKLLRLEE